MVASGECLRIIQISGYVRSFKYSPKGDQMAGASYKDLILWDVDTGVRLHALDGHSASIQEFSYSSQGNLLATASDDYTVRLWDTETGTCRQIMNGHSGFVRGVVFSPGGDLIASSSSDRTVRLWDVGAGTPYNMSPHGNSSVVVIKFSPKRDRVASCNGKTVWLLDVGNRRLSLCLTGTRRLCLYSGVLTSR
jgi:WD40 repeat protein